MRKYLEKYMIFKTRTIRTNITSIKPLEEMLATILKKPFFLTWEEFDQKSIRIAKSAIYLRNAFLILKQYLDLNLVVTGPSPPARSLYEGVDNLLK